MHIVVPVFMDNVRPAAVFLLKIKLLDAATMSRLTGFCHRNLAGQLYVRAVDLTVVVANVI